MAPDRIGRRGHRRTPRRRPDRRGPRRSRHHVPHGSNGTGWNTYGGTSASSPIIASVYALAGTPTSSD